MKKNKVLNTIKEHKWEMILVAEVAILSLVGMHEYSRCEKIIEATMEEVKENNAKILESLSK